MNKDKLAQVFHFDLYGKREDKYNFLNENSISSINWTELNPQAPEHFFVNKNFDAKSEYDEGFSVSEFFVLNNVGIVSGKDELFIGNSKEELSKKILENKIELEINKIKKIAFYPFDNKSIYYDGKLIERAREKIMFHVIDRENTSIIIGKQCVSDWRYIFTTKIMSNLNLTGTAGRFGSGYIFPLYIYPDEKNKDLFAEGQERKPNLNKEIVNKIAEGLGLEFVAEKTQHSPLNTQHSFAPIDILDYIYAVLHSPSYREKYKEFLKIDFPKIPYPSPLTPEGGIEETQKKFWQLVKLGSQIREIHLLESEVVENYITQYPIDGDNMVEKLRFEINPIRVLNPDRVVGKVFINETQYFDNVPEIAWNFYIGGYQPAQKWLKDRKGNTLNFEDIFHYQKIIVALTETDKLMQEIDKIEME